MERGSLVALRYAHHGNTGSNPALMDIPYVDIRLSKIFLLTGISQQPPSRKPVLVVNSRVTLLSIPAARAPDIDLRMPIPQTVKFLSLHPKVRVQADAWKTLRRNSFPRAIFSCPRHPHCSAVMLPVLIISSDQCYPC